jgi:lysophospholipase L1-like esterase
MTSRSMVTRGALAGVAFLAGELAYAARRPLPTFTGLDPSGCFGDPSSPLLRLTVLGDSTITGPGLDDVDDTFIRIIAHTLSDRYCVELNSFAVGGARSIDLLRSQVPSAIELDSDITMISVGGNDVMRAVPVRVFERNLEAIVAVMKTVSKEIVLMGIGDMGTVPRCPPPLDRVATMTGRIANRVHQRVAQRQGVQAVDHWGWSAEAFRDPLMFSPDLFHPSPAGHRVWAETVLPEVEAAIDRLSDGVLPGRPALPYNHRTDDSDTNLENRTSH